MFTSRDNVSLGCAGLAEGTNANTFKTSNILHYQIAGRSYVKAATDNIAFTAATGVTFEAQAASKTRVYFVLINAAGDVTVKPSSSNDSTATGGVASFEWPNGLADVAVIGAIKVATAAATTFTPGSTDLGAAGVTDTYINVGPDYGVAIAA